MILDKRIDKYLRVFDGDEMKYLFVLDESKTYDEGEEVWSAFAGKTYKTEELRRWAKKNGYLVQIGLRAKPSGKNTQKYWDY